MFGFVTRWVPLAFSSFYNDRILRPKRFHFAGSQTVTDKIAIFLIFPKYGVLENHLHSLRYLVANGYSPLLVSNLPLNTDDIARLKPLTWRIMQRQNFGYDFGGYLDAVLDLAPYLRQLKRLVFLNDSCWFPLAGKANWLKMAEDSGMDAYWADEHRGLPPSTTTYLTFFAKTQRSYFASYAISIGEKVVQSPNFFRFWRSLQISNGKGRTIRRGEHGLSKWLKKSGFSCDALSKNIDLRNHLLRLSAEQFANICRSALSTKEKKYFRDLNDAEDIAASRMKKNEFIEIRVNRTGIPIVLPRFAIERQNYPFLKKSATGRKIPILRQIILDLNDPMSPQMLQEFNQRYGL